MEKIKVETIARGNLEKIWEFWNKPEHITKWAFASEDWECPYAENDLREGGKMLIRMSAKDKSSSFDVIGQYKSVIPMEKIEYTMEDSREVSVHFKDTGEGSVKIEEEFDAESINSEELQRNGWQSILDNFKKYAEASI